MGHEKGKGRLDVPEESDVYNDIKPLYPLRDELVRRMGDESATLVDLYVTNPILTTEVEGYLKGIKENGEIPEEAQILVRNLPENVKVGNRVFPSNQHGIGGMGGRILDVLDVFGKLVEKDGRTRHEKGYYNDVFDYVSRAKAVEAALVKADRSGLRRIIRIGGPEINVTPKIWFPGVKDVRVNGESLNRYNAGAEDLVRKLVNQYR